jgi:hypothetical protein
VTAGRPRGLKPAALCQWERWALPAAVLGAGLLLAAGCTTPPAGEGYDRALAPTIDRLVAAYPDLASKKFQIIADFEAPAQGTLFRELPAGAEGPRVSTEQARLETGVGALKMPLNSSTQQVVAADTPESQWALFRDWSRHHLLIFSVFSPRKLGGFLFSIRSGTDVPLIWTHPRIFLTPGWNLIRVDLGDLADQVNLADVRELRFWCDPLEAPVDLYLDDLVLVNNSQQIFGPEHPSPGELYVRAQGRRLVAGAAERFELVFSRGQIRQWFDLSSDPALTHNLTGGGSLGPTPLVVPDDVRAMVSLDDASQWSGLGLTVEAHQTLEEASPLRVVVRGEWRFRGADDTSLETAPTHQWVYSIYHDGRVYVECSGDAQGPNFTPPGLGMAFATDGEAGFTRTLVEGRIAAGSSGSAQHPFVLFSRPGRSESDLLIVPFKPLTVRGLTNPNDPRLGALWQMPVVGERFGFATLMRIWPADIDSPALATPLAVDYCRPLPIAVDAGSLARTDPGDFDGDGFSEARGYYTLQLDGTIARVRLSGRERVRFSPVFKLTGVAQRDVWVYIDGRLIETRRDKNGDALFEVSGTLTGERLIEVVSRERETPAAGPGI